MHFKWISASLPEYWHAGVRKGKKGISRTDCACKEPFKFEQTPKTLPGRTRATHRANIPFYPQVLTHSKYYFYYWFTRGFVLSGWNSPLETWEWKTEPNSILCAAHTSPVLSWSSTRRAKPLSSTGTPACPFGTGGDHGLQHQFSGQTLNKTSP